MALSMQFTDTQKGAIVSLIIEMANVDNDVSLHELRESNLINAELAITDEIFTMGRALDVAFAVEIMRHMSDKQKLYVAQLLTRMIDADKKVDDNEIAFLNWECLQTGADILLEREP